MLPVGLHTTYAPQSTVNLQALLEWALLWGWAGAEYHCQDCLLGFSFKLQAFLVLHQWV